MPKRIMPRSKRHLNPRTHSNFCESCDSNEDNCQYFQANGLTRQHRFRRRTIAELEVFAQLERSEIFTELAKFFVRPWMSDPQEQHDLWEEHFDDLTERELQMFAFRDPRESDAATSPYETLDDLLLI